MSKLRVVLKSIFKEEKQVAVESPIVDSVFKAFALHSACRSWQESLKAFVNNLEGKITALAWQKLPNGVLEIISIKFPDSTALRMTRFIGKDGNNNSITIKRVD